MSIFVSYRRAISPSAAGRLADTVRRSCGAQVFLDVQMDRLGIWPDHIKKAALRARVMLVVIGPGWADVKDDQGHRRLDNAEDWVRLEIATGLESSRCLVVPVLVDGATEVPDAKDLPTSLHRLRYCQAVTLREQGWNTDVRELVALLRKESRFLCLRRLIHVISIIGIAAVTITAWFLVRPSMGSSGSRDGGSPTDRNRPSSASSSSRAVDVTTINDTRPRRKDHRGPPGGAPPKVAKSNEHNGTSGAAAKGGTVEPHPQVWTVTATFNSGAARMVRLDGPPLLANTVLRLSIMEITNRDFFRELRCLPEGLNTCSLVRAQGLPTVIPGDRFVPVPTGDSP